MTDNDTPRRWYVYFEHGGRTYTLMEIDSPLLEIEDTDYYRFVGTTDETGSFTPREALINQLVKMNAAKPRSNFTYGVRGISFRENQEIHANRIWVKSFPI